MDFDEKKFFLGKLCPRGHEWNGIGQTLRYLSNEKCFFCRKQQYEENREKLCEQKKQYYEENREKLSEQILRVLGKNKKNYNQLPLF